jgi:hypothetical protein
VDGASAGTVASYTFTNVIANHTISVEFEIDPTIEYGLTVSIVGQGTVTKNPDNTHYHYGDTVILTADPDTDWVFSTWSGDATGSTNPKTITIDGNKTVTATFIDTSALQKPTAVIGQDREVDERSSVELDGSASHSNPVGRPLTYRWSRIGSHSISLNSASTARSSFTAPDVDTNGGFYSFQLIVNDGFLDSDPATISIGVKDIDTTTPPPDDDPTPPAANNIDGGVIYLPGTGNTGALTLLPKKEEKKETTQPAKKTREPFSMPANNINFERGRWEYGGPGHAFIHIDYSPDRLMRLKGLILPQLTLPKVEMDTTPKVELDNAPPTTRSIAKAAVSQSVTLARANTSQKTWYDQLKEWCEKTLKQVALVIGLVQK